MSVLRSDLRPGVYCDSIVLMQLQSTLADLPGVEDAGAVMGTDDNLALLKANKLLPKALPAATGPSDLVLVVRAENEEAATAALGRVDELLARRRATETGEFRPRTLTSAARQRPDARWVLVSVPGRHAARVARQALDLNRHVFLFSDNVPLDQEIELKRSARERGLLVMGPDCGTAILNGVGFGFANRVRRGGIGLVAASGTGLQAISTHVHAAGAGVSHAIGTGGRDLSAKVGAITAIQGLELLSRDPETRVIVLVSKPPAPEVTGKVLAVAGATGKPVVLYFQGDAPSLTGEGNLHVATSLREAGERALELLDNEATARGASAPPVVRLKPIADGSPSSLSAEAGGAGGCLRALFAGGTLASEAVLMLRDLVPLRSNIAAERVEPLPEPGRSLGHTILDLGADEFTVGRPHPMIDHDLRIRRLEQETDDPEVRVVLLDVVLGDGAHPDPASALAPAIESAAHRPDLDIVALLIGTDEDHQIEMQADILSRAGAHVRYDLGEALSLVRDTLGATGAESARPGTQPPLRRTAACETAPPTPATHPVDLADLQAPVSAINVGLESFYESLLAQDAKAIHVDWRPPAGGDETLMAILDKMRLR
jgi:FdrA protein